MTSPCGWTLRTRFVALLLATLVPLAGLLIYWIQWEVRHERIHVMHGAQEIAALVAADTGRLISGVQGMLAALARSPAARAPYHQGTHRLFRDLLASSPLLENLGLVASDGSLKASAIPMPPGGRKIRLQDREWFRQAIRTGQPAIGGFQVCGVRGTPSVCLAHPVQDRTGRVSGVIYATVRLAAASREVIPSKVSPPNRWAVLDAQGVVILHSEPWGAIGKPLDDLPGTFRVEAVPPGTPWRVIVDYPEDVASLRLRQALLRLGLPAGLILLVALGSAFCLARSTWRPLQALVTAVRGISVGAPPSAFPVGVPGEVGEVAAAFRDALEILTRRQQELTALLQANQAIASSLDLDQILENIVHQAAAISGTPLVRLFLLDQEAQVLRCHVQVGFQSSVEETPVLSVGESFSGEVATTGEPLAVADCRGDPRLLDPQHAIRFGLVSYLGLPVKFQDRLLGVLAFHVPAPRVHTAEEIAYLSAFAQQAALAIQNARLFRQEQERRRQLDAVRALSEEIARELDLGVLLGLITRRAAELVGATSGTVFLWDEATGLLVPRAWHGLGDWRGEMRLRLGEGVSGTAAQRRQGIIVNHLRSSPFALPRWQDLTKTVASLAEPLLYRDQLLGVINVGSDRAERVFTERDRETLAHFAAQAAIAIENARLYSEAQERTAHRAALFEVGKAILGTRDLQPTIALILERALELTGAAVAGIAQYDSREGLLRYTHRTDFDPGILQENVVRPHEDVVGRALAEGTPVWSADVLTESQTSSDAKAGERMRALKRRAVLAAPLIAQRLTHGALILYYEAARVFEEDEVEVITALASLAAIAIENARLFRMEQERREQLDAARAVTAEITRELDLTALLNLIHRRAIQLVGVQSGAIWLWDDGVQALVPAVWHSRRRWPRGAHLRLGEGVVGTAALRREGLMVNHFRTSPYATPLLLEMSRHTAVLAEPLVYQDRLLGVISVNNEGTGRKFTTEDQDLLRLFASQAAVAIENARLFAELNESYRALQQAQEELVRSEKLRALGQMAAGIAHDLNNVLAAILGQVELLKLQLPEPVPRDRLRLLETAATDGAQVVRRLQGFARQQPAAALAPCDLAALVKEAVEITRPRWKDEPQRRGVGIAVHTHLSAPGGLPPILGNPAELREVLTNLLLNAVDAMPEGGTLTLAAHRVPKGTGESEKRGTGETSAPILRFTEAPIPAEGEWVELTVTDTGKGMSEGVRRRIFEPFFTTKGVQGSGLGLAVAYGILERHGGRIEVASTPGAGTTFTLRLRAAPPGAVAPASPSLRTGARRRLLLIDDDPVVRQTVGSLLRAAGHTVTEASGGAAGLAGLAAAPVDLVLTDLGMPEVTGWDVARAVKAAHPALPVVLLTGWGDQPGVEGADAGPDGLVDRVVGKPFRLEELLATIAECTGSIPADGP